MKFINTVSRIKPRKTRSYGDSTNKHLTKSANNVARNVLVQIITINLAKLPLWQLWSHQRTIYLSKELFVKS